MVKWNLGKIDEEGWRLEEEKNQPLISQINTDNTERFFDADFADFADN